MSQASADGDGVAYAGPGWPILAPAMTPSRRIRLFDVLWSRSTVAWYVGAAISLVWLLLIGQEVVEASPTAWQAIAGATIVVAFAIGFLVAAPLSWAVPGRRRMLVAVALFALSFALFPWLGWGLTGAWSYVGVTVGMGVLSWAVTWPVIVGLGLAALLAAAGSSGWSEDVLWSPVIIVSISMMMAAFGRNLAAMNQLRATQRQLEELAIERERGRVARDIHDILGHSLTIVTVKAELAGRLVDVDPARARREIGEVESLARGALADVRATVAGVRGVSIGGELAAAREALAAAGIRGELPGSTEAVPPARRELAGWVVREGVTNVVRHSRASVCRIRLSDHEISVDDDGVGPGATTEGSTGLLGLRERVETAGGRMSVGRGELGGFGLRVTL